MSTQRQQKILLLQQGEYSVVKLKLPGNATESDYYVKRVGSKLILNVDIVVYDFSVMSTQEKIGPNS